MKEALGVGGNNRRRSGRFNLRVPGSVEGESQRNWFGIHPEKKGFVNTHERGKEVRGRVGKASEGVEVGSSTTQGDTGMGAGYKAGVVVVVLVTGLLEDTQKNEALCVHLYGDLQGSFSEESMSQNSV